MTTWHWGGQFFLWTGTFLAGTRSRLLTFASGPKTQMHQVFMKMIGHFPFFLQPHNWQFLNTDNDVKKNAQCTIWILNVKPCRQTPIYCNDLLKTYCKYCHSVVFTDSFRVNLRLLMLFDSETLDSSLGLFKWRLCYEHMYLFWIPLQKMAQV